ncbi:MAG TPA: HAD family phosphatase [Candidatus Angelobacter sp.]|nr:HAD family phosphatase [Candidatus Angelobacter sp.]
MLRGIVFDFDGVVVDSHPEHRRAWKALFASLGKEVTDSDLELVAEGGKRQDILRHFLGELTDEQVRDYGEQKEALRKSQAEQPATIPGLLPLLAQIEAAGLPMAVASSGSGSRIAHTLQQLNLKHYFQFALAGEDVSKGKPDPAIFQLAAARMNLAPEDILVCEDAVFGVQAARAAGMKCLGVAPNGRESALKSAGAEWVVADFTAVTLGELRLLFLVPV